MPLIYDQTGKDLDEIFSFNHHNHILDELSALNHQLDDLFHSNHQHPFRPHNMDYSCNFKSSGPHLNDLYLCAVTTINVDQVWMSYVTFNDVPSDSERSMKIV